MSGDAYHDLDAVLDLLQFSSQDANIDERGVRTQFDACITEATEQVHRALLLLGRSAYETDDEEMQEDEGNNPATLDDSNKGASARSEEQYKSDEASMDVDVAEVEQEPAHGASEVDCRGRVINRELHEGGSRPRSRSPTASARLPYRTRSPPTVGRNGEDGAPAPVGFQMSLAFRPKPKN